MTLSSISLLSLPEVWDALRHGGLLIAPARLTEHFPQPIAPLSERVLEDLRRSTVRTLDGEDPAELVDLMLEGVLGFSPAFLLKGNQVDNKWTRRALTGEALRPSRLWLNPKGPALPVFLIKEGDVKTLGVGRGKRPITRVLEWLRQTELKIALVTNGLQWRVVYAGSDHDAWAEADTRLFLREGTEGPNLLALRGLLNATTLTGSSEQPAPLLDAIDASRRGQSEVSAKLGERVRKAVEHLVRESSSSIQNTLQNDPQVTPKELYLAASRVMMRLVVVLFAEARQNLLPLENPLYYAAYSLRGLRDQLDPFTPEQLRERKSAWTRVLSLFRLVYHGSAHESLPVKQYGGGLFTPADPQSDDPVLRALHAFENPEHSIDDHAVLEIINLITRTPTRVRQGRTTTTVNMPVDFGSLSSEYIGILYEGLLDYELRQAEDQDPTVFLNIGSQPAMPLSRLEALSDKEVADLLKELKSSKKADNEDEEEVAEEPEEEAEDDTPEEDLGDEAEDTDRATLERVMNWARRAVVAAKMVKGKKDQAEIEKKARELAPPRNIIQPGQWFLVRWGGTRKGSGTFYTRPQLAIPTIKRTLEPLAYQENNEGNLVPKTPLEILSLKVCDPAMGSGSFLVGALRYLTDALFESLHHHKRITQHGDQTLCQLGDGSATNSVLDETLPLQPQHPDFEEYLKARLKRHVVERCIYGVDFDPLAVELARMALWVETMNRDLPFEFVDHKLKCGNSLVGCWMDRVYDYPIMAWARDGGDKDHKNFVHHFYTDTKGKPKGDVWNQTIKEAFADVRREMSEWISRISGQTALEYQGSQFEPMDTHRHAFDVFKKLEEIPLWDSEQRRKTYENEFKNHPETLQLKSLMDVWIALWFWPVIHLSVAPRPQSINCLSPEALEIVRLLKQKYRFFHWEIEFPDVFHGSNAGFSAVIGNPPWEIQKPNSKEYFSNLDPLYRGYGKQTALDRQNSYFDDEEQEKNWLEYLAFFKDFGNFVRSSSNPFGAPTEGETGISLVKGKANSILHYQWESKRKSRMSFSITDYPYQHQGSADLNTYKLFSELGSKILQNSGRIGLIIPAGIYTDKGCTSLRKYFLQKFDWEWLYSFENRNKIFDIHGSFKFCVIILTKGASTGQIKSAFMKRELTEWQKPNPEVIEYGISVVKKFSPESLSFLEMQSNQDLITLNSIYENGVLLGNTTNDGWSIRYAREFDLTNDSSLFPPVPKWDSLGYKPSEFGYWFKGNWRKLENNDKDIIVSRDGLSCIAPEEIEDIALPLYEGRMIGQYDYSEKGWVSGKGRTAVWRDIPFDQKSIEPQYLISIKDYRERIQQQVGSHTLRRPKIAFMDITSATNERTSISSFVGDMPCGNSAPIFTTTDPSLLLPLSANMNSFVFDYVMRKKCGGLHLNYFVLEDSPLIRHQRDLGATNILRELTCQLTALGSHFDAYHGTSIFNVTTETFKRAIQPHERLRLRCIIEAIIASLYGLSWEQYKFILADCDHPVSALKTAGFSKRLDPKGFWRTDKEKDPELRLTVLSQVAFRNLLELGLTKFINQNEGEGWMLPEELRLLDYGLGHDEHASKPMPVASILIPPHASETDSGQLQDKVKRNKQLLEALFGPAIHEQASEEPAKNSTDLFGNLIDTDLFGNPIPFKGRRK